MAMQDGGPRVGLANTAPGPIPLAFHCPSGRAYRPGGYNCQIPMPRQCVDGSPGQDARRLRATPAGGPASS
jgi:hypothetical protein